MTEPRGDATFAVRSFRYATSACSAGVAHGRLSIPQLALTAAQTTVIISTPPASHAIVGKAHYQPAPHEEGTASLARLTRKNNGLETR